MRHACLTNMLHLTRANRANREAPQPWLCLALRQGACFCVCHTLPLVSCALTTGPMQTLQGLDKGIHVLFQCKDEQGSPLAGEASNLTMKVGPGGRASYPSHGQVICLL